MFHPNRLHIYDSLCGQRLTSSLSLYIYICIAVSNQPLSANDLKARMYTYMFSKPGILEETISHCAARI